MFFWIHSVSNNKETRLIKKKQHCPIQTSVLKQLLSFLVSSYATVHLIMLLFIMISCKGIPLPQRLCFP